MSRRVVITGYGAVASLGESAGEIWASILEKRVGYAPVQHADPAIKARFFGFLPQSRQRYAGFPKALLKCLPPFAKNALVASREALTMAFGAGLELDAHYGAFERGVIIGTGWGGLDSANINNNDYRASGVATSFATIMSMNNAATAAASMQWQLRGYQNSPTAACATGAMAIGDACEVIRSGRAKMMLAGGSESLREQFNVWSIDVIQALSKEQDEASRACCPFNATRSGFVLSEGAAVVCLEDYEVAVARGARILGEVTGYANYSDAHDMTAPAPDLAARIATIEGALRAAGRAPADVDYINAHGTSTPLNDLNESDAIKAAMGQAAYRVPVSSTKSYSGHLIGAAGALETIVCLKALETGLAPATLHLTEPDPRCDLDYVPNEHRALSRTKVALNLSFGFGGANAALVLEKGR
jgi:3-oxoacyl-[acyl-carrier-protein] synthase II